MGIENTNDNYIEIIDRRLYLVYNEFGLKLSLSFAFCSDDRDNAGEEFVHAENSIKFNYPKKFPCYILPDVSKHMVTGRHVWYIVYPEVFREFNSYC